MKNIVLSAYTAEEIRRKQDFGRRNVIEKVFEELCKRVEEAANNNYHSVRIDFDEEVFKNFNIDNNVMRSIRNRFEVLKFSVHLSKFRKYISIQW